MDDLFDNLEEKKEKQPPVQTDVDATIPKEVEPTFTVPPEKLTSDKGNLKKTAVTAALLFLIPFCAALIFAFIAKQVSPTYVQQREGIAAEQEAEANPPAIPPSDACVAELLEYRNTLRSRGEAIDSANIRLWAAAGREPTLLFTIPTPGIGNWSWCISQCGKYALAIENPQPETVIREVALYNLMGEKWVWQRKLPWPDNYESPWIFNGHLVLRSSKNNRRFAMELDQTGKIISLDSLGSGELYTKEIPDVPEALSGEPVALRSNVIFLSEKDSGLLKAYTSNRLPGLYAIGSLPYNACISGNGLLKFTAEDGSISATDAFTEKQIALHKTWTPSTNTVVKGVQATRDGSTVTVHLTSTFNFDKVIERNWCITWKPAEGKAETNMTNAPAFTPASEQKTVDSPTMKITLALHDNSMLEIRDTEGSTKIEDIDLSRYIPCGDDPVQSIALLEDERFLLIKQSEKAYLLDLFAVNHYAGLLDKMEHSKRVIAKHSDEELSRTNIADNAMRELNGKDRGSDAADNFNYEMKEYDTDFMRPQDLEPPAKPSIVSLQAEFYATHHAWLYAAGKLAQLMQLQEHDHRAPKANPLLLARYATLAGDKKTSKLACRKGLSSIFYDNSPYNKMIRWQMLKMLFE